MRKVELRDRHVYPFLLSVHLRFRVQGLALVIIGTCSLFSVHRTSGFRCVCVCVCVCVCMHLHTLAGAREGGRMRERYREEGEREDGGGR